MLVALKFPTLLSRFGCSMEYGYEMSLSNNCFSGGQRQFGFDFYIWWLFRGEQRFVYFVYVSPTVFTARTLLFFAPIVILIIRNNRREKKQRVNFVFMFCLFYAFDIWFVCARFHHNMYGKKYRNEFGSYFSRRVLCSVPWMVCVCVRARRAFHFPFQLLSEESLYYVIFVILIVHAFKQSKLYVTFHELAEEAWAWAWHHVRRKLIGKIERTTK